MRITIAIIVLLFIFGLASKSQVNKYGNPFVTNYTAEEYSAEPQNWATVCDKRGVEYFGNNNGILEYDGVSWRLIHIPNNSIVRSLAVDENGTVFAGASGEFGFLAPDSKGLMQYHSLVPLVDSVFREFSDVWKIYVVPGAVYFGTNKYLFKYDYKKITIIGNSYDKKGNLFFFVKGNDIYLGNVVEGLLKYKDLVFEKFLNSGFFAGKYIVGFNKIDDKNFLVTTYMNGAYIFNKDKGIDTTQETIPPQTTDLLRNSLVLGVTRPDDEHFVFSTNNNGVIITDKKLNLLNIVSTKEYLQNNIVYAANTDINNDVLWCSLDNGISKIEINSPFRFFDKSQGFDGSILDIIKFNGNIYFATNVGLYLLTYENMKPHFIKIVLDAEQPSVEVWKLLQIEENGTEKLIAGTNFGIFYIDGQKSKRLIADKKISQSKWAVISLLQSKDHSKLFAGLSSSFIILKKTSAGYITEKQFPFKKEIRSIYEDDAGNIWIGTHYDGIIKIDTAFNISNYGKEKGLTDPKDPVFYSFNGDFVIASPDGLFTYDENTDKIIHYDKFGEEFTQIGVYAAAVGNNTVWLNFFDSTYESVAQINLTDNKPNVLETPFKRVDFKGIRKLYCDDDGILWIGTPDAVYTYDTKYRKNYDITFNTLIRKVYLKNDSVLFNGTFYSLKNDSVFLPSLDQNPNTINELDYKYNTIIFEWASTFYEDEKSTEYSYILEGQDNEWSKWTNETKYVFTNLYEGDYTFKVKAKNKYGIESTVSSYSFTILPPWYRSVWAIISYIVLSLLLIFLIVKWYTRKLKRENIRLEKIVAERTKEIRQKNAELEQQKEEIIAQAEELQVQRDLLLEKNKQIEEKNENIQASIQYASRIQSALLPPTNPFENFFSDYFILYLPRDIVSGDFYWLRQYGNRIFVAAADCTGHGVPGAFMSMLGVSLLNEIVDRTPSIQANELLNKLRENVIRSLHQKEDHGTSKDGMDMTLFIYDKDTNEVSFAGANNPLILVRSKKYEISEAIEGLENKFYKLMETEKAVLVDFKPDKMPIGVYIRDEKLFRQHKFTAHEGDTIYMLSDGYPDQFGGEKGQKFMIKRLKQLFIDMYELNLEEQKKSLHKAFVEWLDYPTDESGNKYHQIDDVLILAVRF